MQTATMTMPVILNSIWAPDPTPGAGYSVREYHRQNSPWCFGEIHVSTPVTIPKVNTTKAINTDATTLIPVPAATI